MPKKKKNLLFQSELCNFFFKFFKEKTDFTDKNSANKSQKKKFKPVLKSRFINAPLHVISEI